MRPSLVPSAPSQSSPRRRRLRFIAGSAHSQAKKARCSTKLPLRMPWRPSSVGRPSESTTRGRGGRGSFTWSIRTRRQLAVLRYLGPRFFPRFDRDRPPFLARVPRRHPGSAGSALLADCRTHGGESRAPDVLREWVDERPEAGRNHAPSHRAGRSTGYPWRSPVSQARARTSPRWRSSRRRAVESLTRRASTCQETMDSSSNVRTCSAGPRAGGESRPPPVDAANPDR